jgi:hypothetical protein
MLGTSTAGFHMATYTTLISSLPQTASAYLFSDRIHEGFVVKAPVKAGKG